MFRPPPFLAIPVLWAALGPPVSASAEEPRPEVYDLDRSVERAIEANRSLEITRTEEDKARARVREAWAGALPQLGLEGRLNRNFKLPSFYFGGFPSLGEENGDTTGNGGEETQENVRIEVGSRYDYTATLSLTQPLWLAGKVGAALKAAKIYRRSAEKDVEAATQDIVLLTKSLFYRALLASEETEVYRTALDQAVRHRELAALRYETGLVSEYEFLRAEVEAAEAEPLLIAAESEAVQARNDLKIALGLDLGAPVEIRGELEYDPMLPEKLEARRSLAVERRPDRASLEQHVRLLEQNVRVQKADRYPNFYLTGSYQFAGNSDDLRFSDEERAISSAGGVYVTFPFWTSGRAGSRVRQAEADLRIAKIRLAEADEEIRKEVVAAELDIESAEKRLAASSKSLGAAEKAYAIAETEYENGLMTQIELMDARLALTRTRVAHLRSVHDALLAEAAWMRIVGIAWGEVW